MTKENKNVLEAALELRWLIHDRHGINKIIWSVNGSFWHSRPSCTSKVPVGRKFCNVFRDNTLGCSFRSLSVKYSCSPTFLRIKSTSSEIETGIIVIDLRPYLAVADPGGGVGKPSWSSKANWYPQYGPRTRWYFCYRCWGNVLKGTTLLEKELWRYRENSHRYQMNEPPGAKV